MTGGLGPEAHWQQRKGRGLGAVAGKGERVEESVRTSDKGEEQQVVRVRVGPGLASVSSTVRRPESRSTRLSQASRLGSPESARTRT